MLNSVIDKVVNCQVQLFLDSMVLANQNAKLTGQTRVFSSLSSSSYESPGNEVALLHLLPRINAGNVPISKPEPAILCGGLLRLWDE
jgi:hypothetical protein